MTSMLETVARAMMVEKFGDDVFDQLPNERAKFLGYAGAALTALRTPTPGMIAAGWAAVSEGKRATGIAKLGPGPGLVDGFTAMIDQALAEGGGE